MTVRASLDRGEIIDFEEEDPHVAACVLKIFLRELPSDSIIPESMHDTLFEAVDSNSPNLATVRKLLSKLPDDSWQLLRCVFQLWATVATNPANKMSAHN